MILDLIGAWYLLSGQPSKISQKEIMNMVQASDELSETKEEFVTNFLYLLGWRHK